MTLVTSPIRSEPIFRPVELRRVGTAATMIAVGGTIIIVAVMMMIGHYNPLVHCSPKALLDGVVIALLIGKSGRWRCLALLGVVYGFVLLVQLGLFYLVPVMAIAGLAGAVIGRTVSPMNRALAMALAAAIYELLAGFGSPIKIYFGTDGKNEPFIWALWFAEWPLRIGYAMIGVWLARRWVARREPVVLETLEGNDVALPRRIADSKHNPISRKARDGSGTLTAVRVVMCMLACTLPMALQSTTALAIVTAIYLIYAIISGMRKSAVHAALGLLWGWILFGVLSYAWNRDFSRVIDLGRTWTLRFAPIALSSIVLVATVRPIELVRLLRRLRLPSAIIIPLSSVIRSIPQSRRMMKESIATLRATGKWSGPFSMLRHPRTVVRHLLAPQLRRWANELAKDAN